MGWWQAATGGTGKRKSVGAPDMVGLLRYPTLLQINTRVGVERLSREAGRRVTLADIDDDAIDGFAEKASTGSGC